ncbi:MAG: hypothetical protein Q7S81_02685 [bacterium]|nr:hypothetical protein [bacterium]
MEAINACILFLVGHIWYWVGFFIIYLFFIGQAIYAYFRLDRPEIKKEFDIFEIEAMKRRIGRYLCCDLIIALVFFLLAVLSLVLKLALALAWI